MSIVWPSATVTIARLLIDALAETVAGALTLAGAVEGVDVRHLDLEDLFDCCLIWTLFAFGATTKVY